MRPAPPRDGRRRETPASAPRGYYRPEGVELAAGWVFGRIRGPLPLPAAAEVEARREAKGAAVAARGLERTRQTLEQVLLESLRTGSSAVLFSGGRDSSALLALAVHVARREGLPLPVPFTVVHPGDAESDESWWQQQVLDHLGLHDREILRVTDEQRLLGDVATSGLASRGLVFPAAVQWESVRLSGLRGRTVITGEGGDDLLTRRRGTPLLLLRQRLRGGGRPSRRMLAEVAGAMRPRWSVPARAYLPVFPPWLPDRVARAAAGRFARDQRAPVRWDAGTLRLLRSRATAVVLHDMDLVAREHDVVYSHPLTDPRVVAALAADGGAWGYAGRTDLFRRLVGDLLPDAVLARTSKARFNATRWGAAERDFAERWDGTGVDRDLVDPAVLRAAWLAPSPPFAAELLLQAAWLAAQGLPVDGQPGLADDVAG